MWTGWAGLGGTNQAKLMNRGGGRGLRQPDIVKKEGTRDGSTFSTRSIPRSYDTGQRDVCVAPLSNDAMKPS